MRYYRETCFLLFLVLALSTLGVKAQDTLIGPKNNYFFSYWYGGNYMPYDTIPGHVQIICPGAMCQGAYCKFFHTDTVLEIHGIAAALFSECVPPDDTVYTSLRVDSSCVEDPSTTNVYEYLRLYTPSKDGDSMILRNQGRVHYTEDPFDHYLMVGRPGEWSMFPKNQRVYEVYFDTVSYVVGDFGVGISQINTFLTENGIYKTWPIALIDVRLFYGSYDVIPIDTVYMERCDGNNWAMGPCNWYHYIFPILDHNCHVRPPDDTSGHAAIVGPTDLGTVIRPNPAHGSVQVVSVMELERVEVYNAIGVKVWEQEADGTVVTIDVSRWTSGTYVVMVHTPLGIAKKQLVVQ